MQFVKHDTCAPIFAPAPWFRLNKPMAATVPAIAATAASAPQPDSPGGRSLASSISLSALSQTSRGELTDEEETRAGGGDPRERSGDVGEAGEARATKRRRGGAGGGGGGAHAGSGGDGTEADCTGTGSEGGEAYVDLSTDDIDVGSAGGAGGALDERLTPALPRPGGASGDVEHADVGVHAVAVDVLP